MAISITNANAVLRPRFAKDLTRVMMSDPKLDSFMGLVKRQKGTLHPNSFGQSFNIPWKNRDPQTASYTFAGAQLASDSAFGQSNYGSWQISAVPGYATGKVSGQSLAVSQGDENAFVDLADEETQGALRTCQREIAMNIFKSGTGSRGRIGALTSTTVTLTNAADSVFFFKDMQLVAAAGDGTGALRSATILRITGIDYPTGVLTLSGDPTALGWSAASGGDRLYLSTDFAAGVSTKIVGLGAWVPTVAPTLATEPTFAGYARYNDSSLYGVRHDATTSSSTAQAILDCTGKLSHFSGGVTTHGFMNPIDWAKFAGGLEATRHTKVENKEYNLGFDAVTAVGQNGLFPILPNKNVPKGQTYLLNMDHIYLVTAGDDIAKIVDEDGQIIRARDGSDDFEVRVRSLANLAVEDVSQQAVIYGIT